MKVVILAGGLGTRLSEYTKLVPKPMVKIGGKPIILRIINLYKKYGFNEFYIALGYKGNVIRNFFKKKIKDVKVNLIETGKNTMTGGRLKRLKKYLKNETFLMTYGDGVSDINIKKLINFHNKNKSVMTLTAVRPIARFGSIKIKGDYVYYFKEKSSVDEGWINGGFFVIEPKIFKYIKNDKTHLEREPFEKLTKKKNIKAFKHKGFWQCMDTKRDKDLLDKIIKEKKFKI
ncbi:sugar phosphate nucleotidyltransferase [Candidatus Pelagibacter sp.]|nr:sugar phosphate nucleotidyltransferase [Candidatus Pelagibacter sp.]